MNLENLIKPIIIILILLVLSLVVYFLRGIFLPLLIAFIISFILSPVTNWLQRLGFKHTTSVMIIFLLFISITLLLVVFVGPVLTGEISTFQKSFKSNIGDIVNTIQETVSKTSFFAEKFEERNLSDILVEKVSSSAGTLLPKVGSLIGPLIIYIVVIPFATFFFLRDGKKMRKNLIELIPNRYFETTLDLMYKLNRQLKNYLIGITISASIVGLLAIIGLRIIGLKYCVFVGVFTGITNTIPYLGPIIGVILASIIAIITGEEGLGMMILMILIVFIVVNLIENAFISPIVVARACKLHPLLVIISIIIGGKIAGLIGMFLGVPVASMIQVIIQTINISIVKPRMGVPEVQQEMP